ncbi:Glycine betaine/proline betaine transport system, ATP-binding protein [Desulfonema magnum]|uniref:Glycine betaine/proline betaine transport system, ATP-binding protein n=2 Tax=Desulfonema magnum TaxID=45655 RepID=A0A975GLJ6_9BACT|nr:Glycine betaine/proline betaine transport system, ATP-binding protein [Desulfonema magnum]
MVKGDYQRIIRHCIKGEEKFMEHKKTEPENSETILRVEDVWKIFGKDTDVRNLLSSDIRNASKEEINKTRCVLGLRNISFNVRRGEFFVIMGLSGSGKSTLIRCLIRLINPSAGKIIVNNEDICAFDKEQLMNFRRYTTAMVFQHFGLLPHYTVLDNVAYGLKVRGMSKEDRYERAREAIETVGLKEWEDYLPSSLSGGMQQRVGMARALAQEPEILLLDEPFSGLDPLIRRQMQDELVDLQVSLQKTMIFVTHDLDEALKFGDRIAIMKDGEIIQLGTPEEIIATPENDYVRDFVQDASPAKVLTSGQIMKEPDLLIHEWQGPQATRHMFRSAKDEFAFFIKRNREFVGIITRNDVRELARKKQGALHDILITDVPVCGPDTIVEELFPLATSSPYPITVIDENKKFMGIIYNHTIIDSMYQDTEVE